MSNAENQSSNLLRIGVTGHRFLAEMDKIGASIDSICKTLAALYPDKPWQIISPLAEGADRIVAVKLLALKARLFVPLPLPISTYIEDFTSDASQQEFLTLLQKADCVIELPLVEDRNTAYDQVGHYVLNHCDILIAIWDGQESQGQGGTAEFVELARQKKMPIAWIHAGNRKPGTHEPISLGVEQGKLDFEHFPK